MAPRHTVNESKIEKGEVSVGSGRVRRHLGADDLVGILHRLTALDLVDVLHTLGHPPPYRVLVVEEARVVEADEELAVAGIRVLRARHRDGAAHMRLAIELGLELPAGAAGAGALRTAGLRHEAVDDAVEDDAVVEAIAHQLLDARDMSGRELRPHLNDHPALGGFEDHGVLRVGHGCSRLSTKRMAIGRPAMAPPNPVVNGSGVQRSSASVMAR